MGKYSWSADLWVIRAFCPAGVPGSIPDWRNNPPANRIGALVGITIQGDFFKASDDAQCEYWLLGGKSEVTHPIYPNICLRLLSCMRWERFIVVF